jgi:hypothetical protein
MNGPTVVCLFCDRPVVYGGMEFGASFLHDTCFAKMQEGMDEGLVVIEIESKPLLENYENGERDERGEEAA